MRDQPNSRQLFPFFVFVAACAGTDATDPGGIGSGSDIGSGGTSSVINVPPTMFGDPQYVPAECDYTEANDTTNDYLADAGYVLEATGVTFDGRQRTICGKINVGHFDNFQYSVDIDNYGIDLAADGDVIVTLTGAAQAISSVGVYAYKPDSGDNFGSYFIGDHGVFSAHLTAGHYEFSIEAYDNQDAAADIDYKVQIKTDVPAQRCARVTAPASYTETSDGVTSTGNDMVNIDYTAYPRRTLTSSQTAAAEVANMMMVGGTNYRIHGTSDDVPQVGSYFDRDTFTITTGPTTNQLAVRLNWNSQTADMDYYLFPAGGVIAYGAETTVHLGEDEFGTFPVSPNATYWLWVGASATDSTALPTGYDASICAESFVAP